MAKARLAGVVGCCLAFAAICALLFHRLPGARPAADGVRAASTPLVEGRPVETLFGLHHGLLRYQVKKRSKAFEGRVLRISGIVHDVQSPTRETKLATLRGPGGGASGVVLLFRVQFEPDFARLASGLEVRAACVYAGKIEADMLRFEDCRFTP